MNTRCFEWIAGRSAKFWEIGTAGREVTVRFGRIGTRGQTQVKGFPDDAAAARHVEKLVAQKIAKGYVEIASR
jgi:predicted DNA-binding WGR domain protein